MNSSSLLLATLSASLVVLGGLGNVGCASQSAAPPQLRAAQTFTASDTVAPPPVVARAGSEAEPAAPSPRSAQLRHFYLLSPTPSGALVVTEAR